MCMVRNEELPETGKVTRQIATAIRARMSERGLTQADVGDAIGRAQSYASLRIKGMKPWNVDELEILSPLLGYDNIFTLINSARASAIAPVTAAADDANTALTDAHADADVPDMSDWSADEQAAYIAAHLEQFDIAAKHGDIEREQTAYEDLP